MIEQAVAAYVQEAEEILCALEDMLLALEQGASPGAVDAIFRNLHTLKGSGAMFGYTALARFTHHVENAFDRVRAGALLVDRDLIDISLQARDRIAAFLALGGDGDEAEALLADADTSALIARFDGLGGGAAGPDPGPATPAAVPRAELPAPGAPQRFAVRFRPGENALRNGMRPDLLLAELRALGRVSLRIDASSLPGLETLDPATAYLGLALEVTTAQGQEAIEDVFIFADDAELEIAPVLEDAAVPGAAGQEAPPLPAPAGTSAPAIGQPDRRSSAGPAGAEMRAENVRVASYRLDDMMDSIGELVIAQARLDAVADRLADPGLEAVVEEVGRLVLGLRDATLSIRMMPIETVFGKFRRVVRDLSKELGKDVRLVATGGETEVDKNVIDRLGEPLVHLIRNAMDHGIESAEARQAAGKPAQGTLQLGARQEGGEILITIEDDGGGLDTDAIRMRAIEQGLLAPDADPAPDALHQLIFEPGFSTAREVSSVSGRGVGMDAVRTTLDALGGGVDVSSTEGLGTRIVLRLPVTMAIIDGLRVRLREQIYVIPLSAVEECVELDTDATGRHSGRSVLQIREKLVPFLKLDDLFGLPPGETTRRRVVIVRADGQRVGLVVDDILGQSQTVIKSLSVYHRDIPGLGGATILGDGRVALIIDVATLVRWAETRRGIPKRKAA